MNDVQVKAVRFEGEFVWHRHDETDEAFLVVSGEMEVGFREPDGSERTETVRAGEMIVVPRGAHHITRASAECCALVIEPRGVVNTGEAGGDKTAPNDVWA